MLPCRGPAGSPAVAGESAAARNLTIGVGRDFYDGPDSRAYLHGSTNTWEALTYLGPSLEAVPWLARSWRSSDGCRVWTFTLRQGVKFHDGAPLTAGDVVASVRRIAQSPKYDATANFRHLAKVEASGNEVVFHLKQPAPDFPNQVAYYASPIFKAECFDEQGRIKKFIATGPYKPENVLPGREIVLSRVDDHWLGKPAFEKVFFKFIPDAQTRLMALQAGEIQAVADVGGILPEQVPDLEDWPGVVLKKQEVATTHYALLNCANAPLNTAVARCWLAAVIDPPKLVQALVPGLGVAAKDPYARIARRWAFGLVQPGPGQKPPAIQRELTILLHGGTLQRWPYLDMAQLIQEQLSRQGLAAQIRIEEPGSYYQSIRQGRFDIALQPNTLMTGDPDFFYAYYLAPGAPASSGWQNKEAFALIEKGRIETGPAVRTKAYRRLEEIFSSEMPLIPLYHEISIYAHRDTVPGFYMDHNFRPDLGAARLWEK